MILAENKTRLHFSVLRKLGILLCGAVFFGGPVHAEDFSFTNSLAQAALAEKRGDVQNALKIYGAAEKLESGNATNLCVLTRRYCDLMYLSNSKPAQKEELGRARACAAQAVQADPNNATAHACLAVCYAKGCAFDDIKTELADSRSFKIEAEKTIALDPRQDIAYYLLGRWNHGVANVGWLSQAYVKIIYGALPEASDAVAIEDFKKAIALNPNRIIHHAELGKVYAATGQKNLALAEFKKCAGLKPMDREDADAQKEAAKLLND
jgi:tetratricopeptide (TPR) repeat protein